MKSGLTWWASYRSNVLFLQQTLHGTLGRHGRPPQSSESPGVAAGVAAGATCHGACLQISAASGQVGGDPDGQIDLEVV